MLNIEEGLIPQSLSNGRVTWSRNSAEILRGKRARPVLEPLGEHCRKMDSPGFPARTRISGASRATSLNLRSHATVSKGEHWCNARSWVCRTIPLPHSANVATMCASRHQHSWRERTATTYDGQPENRRRSPSPRRIRLRVKSGLTRGLGHTRVSL